MTNATIPAGYKQTEVGVIPEDWEVQTVGEAFQVKNNLRFPISRSVRESIEGDYPYYGPTSIQGYINEYRIDGEYALIGEDGDHFLKWQSMPMTLLVSGKFNVNNHAHVVFGFENLTAWFYWFFCNRDITFYLSRQGAGRYKLNKATLLKIPCALPSTKEEQTAIATVLSDMDALLDGLDRLITKKRNLKQAAMQQLLTGKTRLAGFEGEWEVKRLGDNCELITKGTTPSSIGKPFTNAGVTFVKIESLDTSGNFIDSTFAFIDEKTHKLLARSQLKKGDILFSIAGALGRTGIVLERILPANTNQALAIIRLREESNLHTKYVYYFLNSEIIKKHIDNISVQGAQANLSLQQVGNILINAPILKEQEAIAAVLADMDAEIAALEQRRTKTRDIKQGMMQELLTGRTRLV